MQIFWRAATISAASLGLIAGSAQMALAAPAGGQPVVTAEQSALQASQGATQEPETFTLTPDEVEFINNGLISAGREPLPAQTVQVRAEAGGGQLTALGADGTEISRVADSQPYAGAHQPIYGPVAVPYGILNPEIKKVIEACVGFSIAGSGLHAIVEQFNTWDKAAKFLVRRFGVVGAVSCAGGIIWHYI